MSCVLCDAIRRSGVTLHYSSASRSRDRSAPTDRHVLARLSMPYPRVVPATSAAKCHGPSPRGLSGRFRHASCFTIASTSIDRSIHRHGRVYAPVAAAGKPIDAHTTSIALRGTIQMLTGHLPFDAETPDGHVTMHVYEPPPPPRVFNPARPFRGALLRALETDPTAFQAHRDVDRANRVMAHLDARGSSRIRAFHMMGSSVRQSAVIGTSDSGYIANRAPTTRMPRPAAASQAAWPHSPTRCSGYFTARATQDYRATVNRPRPAADPDAAAPMQSLGRRRRQRRSG